MKTKTMIIVLAVIATTIISCKSDYTCNCSKVRVSSSGVTTLTSDGSYTFHVGKGRASTECNALEHAGTDSLGSYYRQCQD